MKLAEALALRAETVRRVERLRVRIVGDKGAYASVGTKVLERAAGHAGGPYRIPAADVEALLDDGAHMLEVGDSLMMMGVDHGWRTGPEGCVVSMILLGTPRP